MAESKLKIETVEEGFKPVFADQVQPETKEKPTQSATPKPKAKNVSTLRKMAKFKDLSK